MDTLRFCGKEEVFAWLLVFYDEKGKDVLGIFVSYSGSTNNYLRRLHLITISPEMSRLDD